MIGFDSQLKEEASQSDDGHTITKYFKQQKIGY